MSQLFGLFFLSQFCQEYLLEKWTKGEFVSLSHFVETKIESGEKGAQTIEIIFIKEPFNWLYFWLF